jgi:hypothetical protein
MLGEGLTDFITIPEWASYALGGSETMWVIAYSLFLIGLLVFSFAYGRHFLRTSWMSVITKNTDELVYATPVPVAAVAGRPAVAPAT